MNNDKNLVEKQEIYKLSRVGLRTGEPPSVNLEVKQVFQKKSWDCGLGCAAMAIKFLVEPRITIQDVHRRLRQVFAGKNFRGGMTPSQVEKVLRTFGLFLDLYEGTMYDALEHVTNGFPVLLSVDRKRAYSRRKTRVKASWHFVILVGYDNHEGFLFRDPSHFHYRDKILRDYLESWEDQYYVIRPIKPIERRTLLDFIDESK